MNMQQKKVLAFLIWWITCPTVVFSDASLVYKKHLQAGIEAYNKQYFREAERNFKEAHLIFPNEREPIQYLGLLKKRKLVGELIAARVRIDALNAARPTEQDDATIKPDDNKPSLIEKQRLQIIDNALQQTRQIAQEKTVKPINILERTTVLPDKKPASQFVTPPKKKSDSGVIYLEDLIKNAGEKSAITIELGSSWQIEGKNIQRNLVIDEGIILVDYINLNRIRIKAHRHGSTFLHIWDDIGRRTLQVSVILPPRSTEQAGQPIADSDHAQPLKFNYAADYNTFYYGENIPDMERQIIGFVEYFGVEGETPYGVFDASGAMRKGDRLTHIPNYTVGMSNIPLRGTQDLDLRIFDARRALSPLTLSGAYLRGMFADVNFLEDSIRLSATHGKYKQAVTSYQRGYSESQNVYVDAGKLILFPKDQHKHIAFNYANSHGPNRKRYLSRHVYSMEGMRKLDKVTLKGELARNEDNFASTAGIKWDQGLLKSSVNFRDVSKDFTNVTYSPSNRGEIGATWTTDMDLDRVNVNTSVDIYRDTLYFNPLDRHALNYDMRAHMRNALGDVTWLDSSLHYIHTPGDVSPRRNAGVYERLSRYFDIWQRRRATLFFGGSYQISRYSFADVSEYNRYSLIVGVQVPIIDGLASFVNYEYSWIEELYSNLTLNPNVLNAGLTYSKSFNEQISGNWGLSYRNEGNVKGTNSFLTGEDSISVSSGLNYNPTRDINFFVDGRFRTVWPAKKDKPSYDDLDIRVGMRAVWGAPVRWDPSGIISGTVCLDQNGDGKCNALDKGLYNVVVKAGDKESTTDQNGKYNIKVSAKRVMVSPVLTTLPPGSIFTTPSSVKVNISHGKTLNTDFGVKISSGIYGVVFIDNNGNNMPDSEDQFIGKVRLILDGKTAVFSDNRGVYSIKDISSGNHVIEIDLKCIPDSLIPLIKVKNEVKITEGTTYILHVPMRVHEPIGADEEGSR